MRIFTYLCSAVLEVVAFLYRGPPDSRVLFLQVPKYLFLQISECKVNGFICNNKIFVCYLTLFNN